ncbi:MAG: hypothetical protein JW772_05330 [Candidatus Diapherotrites archaeon]|nr:hypothetical protein [Candidatus Diapherotrites archaeon]
MADYSSTFKLGAGQYQVDFEGNSVRFYRVSPSKGHRLIGNGNYKREGNHALFQGSITHPSPRVVQELAEVAESMFHEHNPNVWVGGHGLWLRRHKPPIGVQWHEKAYFPQRNRPRPKSPRRGK